MADFVRCSRSHQERVAHVRVCEVSTFHVVAPSRRRLVYPLPCSHVPVSLTGYVCISFSLSSHFFLTSLSHYSHVVSWHHRCTQESDHVVRIVFPRASLCHMSFSPVFLTSLSHQSFSLSMCCAMASQMHPVSWHHSCTQESDHVVRSVPPRLCSHFFLTVFAFLPHQSFLVSTYGFLASQMHPVV